VKEIASELNISPKTVEFHLKTAKKKMGLTGAGYTPFFTSIIDKRKLDQIDFKLDQMAEHLKLALDILIELR
jgi:predicted transcriptional regulator